MHCAVTSGFIYDINKTLGTPEILLFIPNNFSFSAIEILTVTTAVDVPSDLGCYFGWQILSVLLMTKFNDYLLIIILMIKFLGNFLR